MDQNRSTIAAPSVCRDMIIPTPAHISLPCVQTTGKIRPEITLDEWVVMPNHFHGIIYRRGAPTCAPHNQTNVNRAHIGAPLLRRRQPGSIGSIIAGFKSAVTKQINETRQTPGRPVWQRNYYEHVIRNDTDLRRIREYIVNNPTKWELDKFHPTNNSTIAW